MKILGIDPGFERLGIAVVEKGNPREIVLESACLRTSAKDDFPTRLASLGKEVEAWITKWQPDALAIEKLFFTNNQKTAMQVAEVRGMIIYLAASRGLKVIEKTPLEIKQTITGFGRADKKQVTMMVGKLVDIPERPTTSRGNSKQEILDDEYDAIAVAITALVSLPMAQP